MISEAPSSEHKPYISPKKSLPELTVRAMLLGAALSVVLAAANVYFGLFAGLTVSASIPAAVLSMAVLRFFRNSNVLENNLVQTAASAGESVAAGVIFTIPALVLMGYWDHFNYWETALIAATGGVLGVLFTIPLRKALIVKEKLTFPEGMATAEVLKTGEEGGRSVKFLIQGSLIGGLFKLCLGSAFNLFKEVFAVGAILNKRVFLYYSMNLSPALIAVGYIVGLNIAFLVFLGGAISWYVAIPLYIGYNGIPEGLSGAEEVGGAIWSSQIRYLGVGAMIVGGLWALVNLRSSLTNAFQSGLAAFKESGQKAGEKLRTEIDTPMSWVLIGIGILIVPVFIIYQREIQQVSITGLMAVIMVIAGFLFSAVAGYMAGLVGSSNNPISGVTIATILASALLLATLMGTDDPGRGAAASILIGAVVCCAAAIAGDNMQDLKAGYELGATPYKQQIMQVIGVIAGAAAIPLVLDAILQGFGLGAPTPETPNALAAPQATLMQSVAVGIFGGGLPWNMVSVGAVIAVLVISGDLYLQKIKSSFRMPVLAVAVGLYLPLELDTSIFIGGLLAWVISRYFRKNPKSENQEKSANAGNRSGLLLASGLITGEALMGVVIALVIASTGNKGIMNILENPIPFSWAGLLVLVLIIYFIYRSIVSVYRKGE